MLKQLVVSSCTTCHFFHKEKDKEKPHRCKLIKAKIYDIDLNKPLDEYRISAVCPLKEYTDKAVRKEIYPIDDVLKHVPYGRPLRRHEVVIDFDGDEIDMCGINFQVFRKYGVVCEYCKIEGKYFAKMIYKGSTKPCLNLFAVKWTGELVLMTKDHIVPLSKGGSNHMKNLRPMCIQCNIEKSSHDI
jgi:5-methylcytosine-specific restriction endonuclease McrA